VGLSLAGFLLLACASFSGCSSSATTPSDKFIGTWTFDSGSVMPNSGCFGISESSLVGETLTLAKGTSADLQSTLQTQFGTCPLQLTVMDSVASANPGQTCMFTVPVGGQQVTVTFDITTWTVTSSNGTTMTTAAAATGTGIAASCMISLTGSATKHAADASAGG
jgi:hypothetical protein